MENDKLAEQKRQEYESIDIQGTFLDPDIHQMNFFVWSGLNQIKRKRQGISTVESWTLDTSRSRYVINASASSLTSNYAQLAGSTLLIKNPAGTIIKRLYKVEGHGCIACKDARTMNPTFSNFAQNYTLAKIVQSDRSIFISELDTLRACAMYKLESIPVGENSNILISEAPLAIAKDGSNFFYVPSTNYGVLLSNGILEMQVMYDQIPYSFCGSM
jgi:hypothetical protein